MARTSDTRDPESTQRPIGMEPTPGGEEDPGMIPPYEGRTKSFGDGPASEALAGTVQRQMDETHGPGRPGATTSPVEESPVSPDEVTAGVPASPHGVGESMTRRGEDVEEQDGKEPGRYDMGTKGRTQRPVGTSDQRSATGVDPQELADEDRVV